MSVWLIESSAGWRGLVGWDVLTLGCWSMVGMKLQDRVEVVLQSKLGRALGVLEMGRVGFAMVVPGVCWGSSWS